MRAHRPRSFAGAESYHLEGYAPFVSSPGEKSGSDGEDETGTVRVFRALATDLQQKGGNSGATFCKCPGSHFAPFEYPREVASLVARELGLLSQGKL